MKKFYFSVFTLFISHLLFAQQATNNASGSGQAGNIILDWSLGELTLVNTVQKDNFMLTQGLHQGRLIAVTNSNSSISDAEMVVTPNPTPNRVVIKTGFLEAGTLSLKLYDEAGKLLINQQEAIGGFSTKTIDLLSFSSAVYMLRASYTTSSGSDKQRTYKIIRLP